MPWSETLPSRHPPTGRSDQLAANATASDRIVSSQRSGRLRHTDLRVRLPKELKFAVGPPPNQIKLACQEKVGGATSGGLLDVKHPPARVHRGRVRDDHLAREHRLDHILGGDLMRQRQRQVRRPAVEWLSRVRVQAVQKLSKKCLGDQLIDGSERGTE